MKNKYSDLFPEKMTAMEFQKSMSFEDDDNDDSFDLKKILEDYPDFDGEIKFSNLIILIGE